MKLFNRSVSVRKTLEDAVLPALVSAAVALILYIPFERSRDQVLRTHNYVLLFHSDAHTAYRDDLTRAWMAPNLNAVRHKTEREYAAVLLDNADTDPGIRIATFAMIDLLTSVQGCVRSGSCAAGREIETFRTFASGFHLNFRPVLRAFDCANDNQSLERLVLFFAPQITMEPYDCTDYIR